MMTDVRRIEIDGIPMDLESLGMGQGYVATSPEDPRLRVEGATLEHIEFECRERMRFLKLIDAKEQPHNH